MARKLARTLRERERFTFEVPIPSNLSPNEALCILSGDSIGKAIEFAFRYKTLSI